MEDSSLEPMQPWGPDGPTIRVGERNPITGYVPVVLPSPGPHPGSSFLTDQLAGFTREVNAQEYAAGFRARLAEIPMAEDAHPSRFAGWEDADTELLEEARHRQWVAEGKEDGYLGTRRLLYDAGHTARENGLPFDDARTEPWKAGWVAAYILIGPEADCGDALFSR